VKNIQPLGLVLIGSSIVGILTLGILGLLRLFIPFSAEIFAYVPLLVMVFTFFIFFVLVRQFLHERLSVLYRSIRKGKMNVEEPFEMSMLKDPIGDAQVATKEWADEKHIEITALKEQDKFRREFLGNLAHELKTPVFSIQGYVLTLLEGGLEDDKVNRVFLERASKAIDRMTHILEDLDTLTKLEVNDLRTEIRPFDVRELAKEVMESLELKAEEKGILLRFSKESAKEIMVLGDRGKIAQVFTNILSNSIAYGKEGGETVIRMFPVDDLITIEISDNGPGIDPQHFPRLFERFYRVEKSRNRNEGGSGLGLSIVKHILDSHNQSISVRSTVGIGSTFIFSLDRFKGSSSTLLSSRGIQIK